MDPLGGAFGLLERGLLRGQKLRACARRRTDPEGPTDRAFLRRCQDREDECYCEYRSHERIVRGRGNGVTEVEDTRGSG